MADNELESYVRTERERGVTDDALRNALVTSGWGIEQINQVLPLGEASELHTTPTTTLRSFTELLNTSWDIYKQNWKTYLGIMLVPIFILAIIAIILGGIWVAGYEDYFLQLTIPTKIIVGLLTAGIALATLAVVALTSSVGLVLAIANKELTSSQALREGYPRISAYFWISFLSTLSIIGGFFFFFVPGVILSLAFVMAKYEFILEGHKGIDALEKSRQITRGYRWELFLRFLMLGGIFLVINLICALPGFSPKTEWIGNLAQFFLSFISTPLTAIFGYLLYQDLKSIHRTQNGVPEKRKTLLYVILPLIGIISLIILVGTFLTVGAWLYNLNSASNNSTQGQFKRFPNSASDASSTALEISTITNINASNTIPTSEQMPLTIPTEDSKQP